MAEPASHTVLVVDDEPSIRLLCRVNLELEHYCVVEARSLAEARAAIEAGGIDVVLLDVHVGQENGLELLGELREREGAPPVALLTGSVELDREQRAGAGGVIGKPFTLAELSQLVGRLTGRL